MFARLGEGMLFIAIGLVLGGGLIISGTIVTSKIGMIVLKVLGATVMVGGSVLGLKQICKSPDKEDRTIRQVCSRELQKEQQQL